MSTLSVRSGLYAGLTTVLVILLLGNRWVYEGATSSTFANRTRSSISFYLQFGLWDLTPDQRPPAIARLVVLVALAALLGAAVGGTRPITAFVGGWAAFLAASVISAGVYGLVFDESIPEEPAVERGLVDTVTSFGALAGTPLGFWVGWVVGLAVLRATRDEREAATGPATTRPVPATR